MYAVGAGGTLDDKGKLFELPADSQPDGLATDDNNNIYIALKALPVKPGKVVVQLVKAQGANKVQTVVTASMATYSAFAGTTTFDGAKLRIKGLKLAPADGKMCAVYFEPTKAIWTATKGTWEAATFEATVSLPTSETTGAVYLRYGECPDKDSTATIDPATILRVSYPQHGQRELGTPDYCEDSDKDKAKDKDVDKKVAKANAIKRQTAREKSFRSAYLEDVNVGNYCIAVDQANDMGQARIISNKRHYIRTFTWGRLVVRHWPNVVPTLTINGSVLSIRQASLAGTPQDALPSAATPTAASTTGFALPAATDGQGFASARDADGAMRSEFFIPPHAPGAMHLDIRFLDPGDSKPKAATAVDLTVDQGYAGSFRLGISRVFLSPKRSFTKLQRYKDGPTEITQTSSAPSEVVVGYSVYFSGAGGRSYAVRSPYDRFGLFIGFGVLGYAPGEPVDFLRSIHIGPEIEISRHMTLALTGVLNRQTELHNFAVGGPAPEGELPTSTGYDLGVAVVLAFSPDFVKVVATGGAK